MAVKISLVLATLNEEENIKDCLASVADLVDEVIVIDASSQDQTRQIAQRMGAKVFKVSHKKMFHQNKQLALEKASGDWILQLDADERVTSRLKKEIHKVVGLKNNISGYYLPRKNYFLGRFLTKGGQYPDYVIRLVKKNKAFFPCQSVHEQIKVKGKVGCLQNDLIHLYAISFSKYLTNANRYTSLTAEKLKKQNTSFNCFNKLKYLFWLPLVTFLNIFIRHKGFVDGMSGFIFSLFSGLHYPLAFIKYWQDDFKKS